MASDKIKHPFFRHKASLNRAGASWVGLTDNITDHQDWHKLRLTSQATYTILLGKLRSTGKTVKCPAPRPGKPHIYKISKTAWWDGIDDLESWDFIKVIHHKQKGRRSGEYELLIL